MIDIHWYLKNNKIRVTNLWGSKFSFPALINGNQIITAIENWFKTNVR